MEGSSVIADIIEDIVTMIFFAFATFLLMYQFNSHIMLIDGLNVYNKSAGAMVQVSEYNPINRVYTRQDILGIMYLDDKYSIIVNGSVYDPNTVELTQIPVWNIPDTNYRKEIEYNNDGSIKYVIFKGI